MLDTIDTIDAFQGNTCSRCSSLAQSDVNGLRTSRRWAHRVAVRPATFSGSGFLAWQKHQDSTTTYHNHSCSNNRHKQTLQIIWNLPCSWTAMRSNLLKVCHAMRKGGWATWAVLRLWLSTAHAIFGVNVLPMVVTSKKRWKEHGKTNGHQVSRTSQPLKTSEKWETSKNERVQNKYKRMTRATRAV